MKIKNASQEDIEYENSKETVSAISRIEIPIEKGFIIINILIANDDIVKMRIVIIYNYKCCTYSTNIKGLCALYTILYYDLHQ